MFFFHFTINEINISWCCVENAVKAVKIFTFPQTIECGFTPVRLCPGFVYHFSINKRNNISWCCVETAVKAVKILTFFPPKKTSHDCDFSLSWLWVVHKSINLIMSRFYLCIIIVTSFVSTFSHERWINVTFCSQPLINERQIDT